MVRETLSHHYTTAYQISLTYLKRQNVIAQTQKHLKKYKLFDLKVKGQIEVTMEHDTPSHDYTPTYQIQAFKIQYGQRSEPAQTKPIQNKHKHCTSQF